MTKEKYVAFDVHLATIAFCILDAAGRILGQGVFQNKAEIIRDFVKGISGKIYLTFEQGTLAAWLYDLVRPLVHLVVVCNPRYNRVVLCGHKSDRIDAQKLAEQLRIGKLRPVYQTDHSLRPLKQLVLGYEALIIDSVRTKTRIKALFQGRGIPCPGERLYSPALHNFWLSKIQEEGLHFRLSTLFRQLDSIMPLGEEAKKNLLLKSRQYPAVRVLKRIPCLGPVRSAQIVAVVGTPHRFRTKHQYWPYCGLAVVRRSTSDYEVRQGTLHRKQRAPQTRGLNQNYSRILKRVYKSAAQQARTHKILSPLFASLLEKGHTPARARLIIARRISSASLTLWKSETQFDPQIFFSNDIQVKEEHKRNSSSLKKG